VLGAGAGEEEDKVRDKLRGKEKRKKKGRGKEIIGKKKEILEKRNERRVLWVFRPCRGSRPPISIVCRTRMVSTRDTGV
jgi:hypothetical protein